MLIRREDRADLAAVRDITVSAFRRPAGPEPVEARLLDELRADAGWLPALSLVALDDGGLVVGHVVCTRGHVEDSPVLGLGPLSVRPQSQRTRVGTALMHAVLGAADALDEPLVALLGSTDFYARFGFRPASTFGITAPSPDWGAFFQVRTLSSYDGSQRGTFRYSPPFARLPT